MASRRQFLGSAVGASALASMGGALAPRRAAAAAPARIALDGFVFNNTIPASVEAARQAAARGVRLWETNGDLTDLWSDHLRLKWRDAPRPLAGLTTPDSLFVLERLGADHRMRVIYRGRHAASRDGRVEHELTGPPALISGMTAHLEGADWAPLLAGAMTLCPARAGPAARCAASGPAASGMAGRPTLVSWIIAPKSFA